MKLSPEQYDMLLEAGRAIKYHANVIPLDIDGNELRAITPNCFLYIACGEDCIIAVDGDLIPRYVW